ncbi:MAG: hypothetical protein WBA16_11670 [Nonlabens sp.]
MKQLLLLLFIGQFAFAQVGINTDTPNPATVLDMSSLLTAGVRGGLGLPSVANDTERAEIDVTNAKTGILIYNVQAREVQIYDAENNVWKTLLALDPVTNQAPTATAAAPTGATEEGEVLTVNYTYNDNEGDAESGTTFQWIRADNAAGLNAVAISGATSQIYTLTATDVNAFISYDVTPQAATGVSPGVTVRSAYVGPVAAGNTTINFVQQNQTIAETADGTADNIDLQFSLSQVVAEDITVTVAANDYTRLDESAPVDIVIPASSSSPYTASAAFNVTDDALQNGDEVITFTITAVTNNSNSTTIGATDTDTVTVTDDDATPASEINFVQQNQTIAETADGTADNIDLQFSLSQVIAEDITVTVAANDYTRLDESAPVNIVIPASSSSPYTASAAFNVTDDALQNGNETITFTITAVSNTSNTTTIGATNTDTVVVTDDDTPTTLLSEDFETDGNTRTGGSRYTTSVPEGQDAGTNASDYFLRTDGSTINAVLTGNNSSFFAAQDIDGVAGNGVLIVAADLPVSLEFAEFTISNQTTFNFSIDLAEDDDGVNQDWDGPDFVRLQYSIDNGTSWITFFAVEGDSAGTNGTPRVDTNLDGLGDGTEITAAWQTLTGSFTDNSATTSLRIRALISLDSGDEDIAIDNITIN